MGFPVQVRNILALLAVAVLGVGCATAPHAPRTAANHTANESVLEHLTGAEVEALFHEIGLIGTQVDDDDDVWIMMYAMPVLALVGSYEGRSIMMYFVASVEDVDVAWVNDWNAQQRWSRAYLDHDGDPVLESDLSLHGGVTRENVRIFLEGYYQSLGLFLQRLRES